MFTAISPLVRRGSKVLLASGTATCIGITGHKHITSTECSPVAYNNNSSDIQIKSKFGNNIDLVFPTMEALLRASRLITCAATMAADYQMNSIIKQHSYISEVYSWIFPNNKSKEKLSKQTALEDKIAALQKDLDRIQNEYTKSPTNRDEKYTGSADIKEHTKSKSQQKKEMMDIANQLAIAEDELDSSIDTNVLHERNAQRLLQLFRSNQGVYIKVGQHLANLDLLIPEEYIQTLSSLFDDAPVSSFQDVCQVVKEELGAHPTELFDDFSETPLASASLAQVHTAICKQTGKKLAIKIQHKGLKETSKGDLFACSTVVGIAEQLFEDFNFGWICEELTPQLPKELDFTNEGKNAETAATHLESTGLDCVIPRVLWPLTSERVLSMEFEEGFKATDVVSIDKAGICRRDVAKLISSVFNSQIFGSSFVHCDPHEANVLLREHPTKKGKPQIVLVDHGLYKSLDKDFTEAYARLWKGIVVANIPEIKSACEQLGVHEMYPLLSSMLTSRPFDEVVERSQSGKFDASTNGGGDKHVIRGYAQRYIKEIIDMLDIVPRQMLLIFKMNDCLRHVDMALGSPINNLVVAGKYASARVYESDKQSGGGFIFLLRSWMSYINVLLRINMYEIGTRLYINN